MKTCTCYEYRSDVLTLPASGDVLQFRSTHGIDIGARRLVTERVWVRRVIGGVREEVVLYVSAAPSPGYGHGVRGGGHKRTCPMYQPRLRFRSYTRPLVAPLKKFSTKRRERRGQSKPRGR